MENLSNVLNFYENLGEIDRLHRGLGVVEGARTKELLSRYIEPGMTVYDVGGGAGYYSDWLAGLGCQVTMFDLAPSAVAYAKTHQTAFYETVTANARRLRCSFTNGPSLSFNGDGKPPTSPCRGKESSASRRSVGGCWNLSV